MEVKNIQQQEGGGNVLLGIGRALGSTIEGAAKGGSSIIRAVGGAINSVLNGAGDLDKKIVESFGDASSQIITSTGNAVESSLTGFGNFFHGILGGIGGTIKWILLLIVIGLGTFAMFHIYKLKKATKDVPSHVENVHTPTNNSDPSVNKEEHKRLYPSLPNNVAMVCSSDGKTKQLSLPLNATSDICTIKMEAVIDTGSAKTMISHVNAYSLGVPISTLETDESFFTANGDILHVLGQIELSFICDKKQYTSKVYVANGLQVDMLLGLEFLQHHQAIINFQTGNIKLKGSESENRLTHFCPSKAITNRKLITILMAMLAFIIIIILTITTTLGYTRNCVEKSKINFKNETTIDDILQNGISTKIYVDWKPDQHLASLIFQIPSILATKLHTTTYLTLGFVTKTKPQLSPPIGIYKRRPYAKCRIKILSSPKNN